MAKPNHKFPETLHVVQRHPDNERHTEDNIILIADADIEGFEDGETVGVYTLHRIVTKRVRHAIE